MKNRDDYYLTTYGEMAAILEQLPTVVRETRRVRRLSVRESCEQIGISTSTLTRIESRTETTPDPEERAPAGPSLEVVMLILNWLDSGRNVQATLPGTGASDARE